jgi:aarF domain-containing kinase
MCARWRPQWAAMRHDLFASRVCLQLSKLQSETRPHSWKQTVAALDRILGEGWQDTLNLHQDSLIGSGCVGQVYKGRMRVNDSQGPHYRDVAIKILHPGVRRSMELDLTLMRSGARMAEWVGEVLLPLLYSHKGHPEDPEADSVPLRCISLMESVKEFAEFMMSQLDLRHETLALDHFR